MTLVTLVTVFRVSVAARPCGTARPDTPVLARGGHAWLHRECWAPMNAERDKAARRAVLVALGLPGAQAEP